MVQFGNKIGIIPVNDVISVGRDAISLLREDRKVIVYTRSDIVLMSNPQSTDAGNLFQYQIVVNVEHFKDAKQYPNIKMVLELFDTVGRKYYMGGKDFPVKCTIKEFIDTYQITFTLTTPRPFILK